MRRAAAVVLGTVTGTALLIGAKLGAAPLEAGSAGDDTSGVVVSGGGPVATPALTSAPGAGKSGNVVSPGVTKTPAVTSTPVGTTSPTSRVGPSKTPIPTKTTSSPKPPASGLKDGTYNASAAVKNGRYGTLSMTVVISSGKITSISAHEDGGETNCYHSSCNTLRPEALKAQSARISSVSGATYSSSAFTSSLQAVLNAAKA
jgi:uncharacterized protein with FMN-binding domain